MEISTAMHQCKRDVSNCKNEVLEDISKSAINQQSAMVVIATESNSGCNVGLAQVSATLKQTTF